MWKGADMPAPCFARLRHVVNNRDVSRNGPGISMGEPPTGAMAVIGDAGVNANLDPVLV
jgi:hypothetical protein